MGNNTVLSVAALGYMFGEDYGYDHGWGMLEHFDACRPSHRELLNEFQTKRNVRKWLKGYRSGCLDREPPRRAA